MDEDDSPTPSPAERLAGLVPDDGAAGDADDAAACVERLGRAPADDRKEALRALREAADDPAAAAAFEPLAPPLAGFLDDPERPVRLAAAKLFVAVAEADPDAAVGAVPALADRLADDDEFYYVRARSAEALGYVALDYPDAVTSPAVLADLRVGLAFDEPEVTEKLAKALALVAVGDPARLAHGASTLADHLDDGAELVRYHLCTALVAVGCERPTALDAARDALVGALDDDCPQVRGRAAEALGVLARADADGLDPSTRDALAALRDDGTAFVAERAAFAVRIDGDTADAADAADETPDRVGSVAAVRATTSDAVAAITAPDDDCSRCGLALPGAGPPMCPRCGAPR
ncbi:HEAT repeat domain-containing protein [Candidatus Halobonum tyrrellensis]|uniref:HEAT repeat containing protein n=1 Tax=Candidatus Halobonum tyrrellensis G22 TaxID=1324957 RepID=V4IWB7_9EURY|nr:HEAT repeat domain-containing protein [Candidatus Halobonum tyrrellensis]ESP87477.1 HEAT repeat containing protein [Candidatus Halobonum tyrrellensis G22]